MDPELKKAVLEHKAEVALTHALCADLYEVAGTFAMRLKEAVEESVICLQREMQTAPEPKDRIAAAKTLLKAADDFAKIQIKARNERPSVKEINGSLSGFIDVQKVTQEMRDEFAKNPLGVHGLLEAEGKEHDALRVGGFHGSPTRPM